jgi:hypothetical protein
MVPAVVFLKRLSVQIDKDQPRPYSSMSIGKEDSCRMTSAPLEAQPMAMTN